MWVDDKPVDDGYGCIYIMKYTYRPTPSWLHSATARALRRHRGDNRDFKVALYTILQRFEYHICVNNVSVGKCLSHSTR